MNIPKNANLVQLICKLFYGLPDEISYIDQDPDKDEFHKIVTFKTGKGWHEMYFMPGSADYQAPEKTDDAGPVFDQALKFIVPGEDDTLEALLDVLRTQCVVIRMEYSSGQSKLLGDLDHVPLFLQKITTNTKSTSSEINFTLLSTDPAPWITWSNTPS